MKVSNAGVLKKTIEDILISESNIGVYDLYIDSFKNVSSIVVDLMTKGIRMPVLYRLMNKVSMYGHGEDVGYSNVLSGIGKSCSIIVAFPIAMKGRTFTYFLGNMDAIDARKTRYYERSENKDIQSLWFFKLIDQANHIPKDFIVGALLTDGNNEKEFAINPNYIGFKDEEYQENFIEKIVREMDDKKRFDPREYDVPRVDLTSREHIEAHLGMINKKNDEFNRQYREFLEKQLELHKTK